LSDIHTVAPEGPQEGQIYPLYPAR
jgi:hypothetical protein